MQADIVVLPGDGIGPEVTAAALSVLRAVARRYGHHFHFQRARHRRHRHRQDRRTAARDPRSPPAKPPTRCCWARSAARSGRIRMPRCARSRACSRCARAWACSPTCARCAPHPAALDASPLKPELLTGVDIMVVRELTGGIYFGEKTRTADSASDLCNYSVGEIERVVRRAAQLARQRRGHVTSVDKANVLETSRLWRDVTTRIGREEFPDVTPGARAGRRDGDAPAGARRATSTSSSPRTCSATSSPTRPRCWPARWACCRRRRWATASVRPLRTDPRLGAGHRRQGHRQSLRDDPQRGDAAAPFAGPARRSRLHRTFRRRRIERPRLHRRPVLQRPQHLHDRRRTGRDRADAGELLCGGVAGLTRECPGRQRIRRRLGWAAGPGARPARGQRGRSIGR